MVHKFIDIHRLKRVTNEISKLHQKKGEFRKRYKELLRNALMYRSNKRFDFEKVIMEVVEKDFLKLHKLHQAISPILPYETKEIFSVNHVYDYQTFPKEKNPGELAENELFEGKVEMVIHNGEVNNTYYIEVMTWLIEYTRKQNAFTLSEFVQHLEETKVNYDKLTKDMNLLRELVIYLGSINEEIDLQLIRTENLNYAKSLSPVDSVDIDYICQNLNNLGELPILNIALLRKDIKIKGDINKENNSCTILETPDIVFRVIERN